MVKQLELLYHMIGGNKNIFLKGGVWYLGIDSGTKEQNLALAGHSLEAVRRGMSCSLANCVCNWEMLPLLRYKLRIKPASPAEVELGLSLAIMLDSDNFHQAFAYAELGNK